MILSLPNFGNGKLKKLKKLHREKTFFSNSSLILFYYLYTILNVFQGEFFFVLKVVREMFFNKRSSSALLSPIFFMQNSLISNMYFCISSHELMCIKDQNSTHSHTSLHRNTQINEYKFTYLYSTQVCLLLHGFQSFLFWVITN